MTHVIPTTLALLCAITLAGCDFISPPDYTVRVSGRVVDSESGEPIQGISVILYSQSHIVVPLASSTTGIDGRFAMTHDNGELPTFFVVEVNSTPYDPTYSVNTLNVVRGETVDYGNVELSVLQNETMGVRPPLRLAR